MEWHGVLVGLVLSAVPDIQAPPLASPLELVAVVPRSRIRLGEQAGVSFVIRNRTAKPVLYLPDLDDSERGVRYPKVSAAAVDARGSAHAPPLRIYCGYINPVDRNDFKTLAPGARSAPIGHPYWDWAPPAPGIYTIEATYDSSPADPGRWIIRPGEPDVADLVRRIAHVKLKARATITVEP